MSFLYYFRQVQASNFVINKQTMKRYFFLAILSMQIMIAGAQSPSFTGLQPLSTDSIHVYFSEGYKERAAVISARMHKAMDYYSMLLKSKPTVTLLVLAETDWKNFTSFPVYGMPHYKDDQTLVVAAHDNAFWKSFLPPLDQLKPELRKQIEKVYSNTDGSITMQPFFDLLALHELGHAYHFQDSLNMQRKWLGELFVNMLLHTYVAENEAASLPALTLFPQMVIAAGTSGYVYTSLKDVDERYNEIGMRHAKNYGWYQSRWHAAAASIYDTAGKDVVIHLWKALSAKKERMDEEALINYLETSEVKPVASMIRNWDASIIK